MKKTNGVTGGNATQVTACVNCFTYASGVAAAAANEDFETNPDVII